MACAVISFNRILGENFIYYDFEDFRLDVDNEKLLKDNEPVLLTNKAFLILHLLVQNAGQLVKKEQLITEIWQDSFIEDSNITQQIYILRKALGNDKNGKPLIETLPKRGYCFVGEIKNTDQPQNEPQVSTTSINQSVTKKRFAQFGLVAVAILLILGAIYIFQSPKTVSTTNEIKSIAVLPFKKISQETDDSKIGFGLADAVINNLSKQQKIPVRSMSAVFQYANKESFDSIEAGKNLGVDSVLEGTVQRDGEQVRVSLRLIKIADGSTIWAETFNEKFSNIFALQDSISIKIAKSLSLNLSAQDKQLVTQKPANAEAYQFYQLGVYFSNTRTKEGLEKAILYFQKTTELDPNYAPAYAMLADSYNWFNEFAEKEKRQELLNKSEEAANKALALDNSLAEAHIAVAFVQFVKYKNSEAGKNSLERAVQLAPYNSFARFHYGWELLRRGELENAYQQMILAQEYAPLSALNSVSLCSILIFKRDYPQALRFCEKGAELQPGLPFVNIQKANVLYLNGRIDEAINLLKLESKVESQKYYALGNLGYIYAKTGKRGEAESVYLQLKENKESFAKYSDLTLVGFTLGEKDEALKNFKQMIDTATLIPTFLTFDPFWEEVFKDDDFKRLTPPKTK